jgi:hypothetical protein
MKQQATEEMVGAVKQQGMSVEEFNQISRAAQADPQLRERIVAMMRQ